MNSYGKLYTIIILALLYLAASVSGGDYNSIALYGLIPLAFALTFFYTSATKVNKYFNILVCLYLWVFFAALFTSDIEMSLVQIKQILGCVILCYVIAVNARDEKVVPWLYVIFLITYIVDINYAINNVIGVIDVGEERMEDDRMNANSLAYSTFYATFIVFIFGEIVSKKWLRGLFRLIFFGIIPLFLWIAYITASRQMMIIQIPLIAVLLFFRYWSFGGKYARTLFVLSLCFVFPILLKYVMSIFEDSLLIERSEDIEGDTRLVLIRETIEIGLKNPIVGVGPGCVQLYTTEQAFAHNTFLELFAGTGVMGMIIFVIMLWKYLVEQIRRYLVCRDRIFLYFVIFGIFFIIDQVFYVFYSSLYLISFFILVATHSETYYQNRIKKLNNVR